jgi:hypothetical protein
MQLSWWWIVDRAEYALTSVRLAILDKIGGPEPPTEADEIRTRAFFPSDNACARGRASLPSNGVISMG